MKEIKGFQGEYRFLSNFYPSSVVLDGLAFGTVGHAGQAAKTLDPVESRYIQTLARPGKAKRYGKKVSVRHRWDLMKVGVMYHLLTHKCGILELGTRLLEIGNATLIEENSWGDTFWGKIPDGHVMNMLGSLLMLVRSDINGKRAAYSYECTFK